MIEESVKFWNEHVNAGFLQVQARDRVRLRVYERGAEINPRLRELPNVVLLPHMGSATREGRVEMGEKVIINIKTFADGHRPPDQVVPGML